ncbi:hypothetical protein I7I48_07648 [Histoplasma ohiense]|nr:hypothetical protein I7I48_07648 [Histoplasma ohiense (nom. inval.)]
MPLCCPLPLPSLLPSIPSLSLPPILPPLSTLIPSFHPLFKRPCTSSMALFSILHTSLLLPLSLPKHNFIHKCCTIQFNSPAIHLLHLLLEASMKLLVILRIL